VWVRGKYYGVCHDKESIKRTGAVERVSQRCVEHDVVKKCVKCEMVVGQTCRYDVVADDF